MICDGAPEVGIVTSQPGWWLLLEGPKVNAYRCPLETCTAEGVHVITLLLSFDVLLIQPFVMCVTVSNEFVWFCVSLIGAGNKRVNEPQCPEGFDQSASAVLCTSCDTGYTEWR